MASRSLVSYDDITLPYVAPHKPKKRRRNHYPKQSAPPPPAPNPDEDKAMDGINQSRELTHEEIWDDSALVEAWNAAMEEYDAYHGPDKGWKKEPVHKSPLWYTIPPRNPPKKVEPATHNPQADESNSQPFDFASFVPTHDPSLSAAVDTAEEAPLPTLYTTPLTFQPPISQDQAFERAVHASYWSGYWTAIYHCHRQTQPIHPETNETEDQDVSSSSSSDEQEVEEFVSTQR